MYRLQRYLLPVAFGLFAVCLAACDSPSKDNGPGEDFIETDTTGLEVDTIMPDYTGGPDENPETGEEWGTGEGHSPYSVLRMIHLGDGLTGETVYVKGYIVGSADRSAVTGAHFGLEGAVKTNLLIANSPDERNYRRCVSIGLDDRDLRLKVNLVDNPQCLGLKITVYGTVKKYMYITGIPSPLSLEIPE